MPDMTRLVVDGLDAIVAFAKDFGAGITERLAGAFHYIVLPFADASQDRPASNDARRREIDAHAHTPVNCINAARSKLRAPHR